MLFRDGLEITGKALLDIMPVYTLTTTLLEIGMGQSKETSSLMT